MGYRLQRGKAHLNDADGMHYIAFLLSHPHREFHVFELVAAVKFGNASYASQLEGGNPHDKVIDKRTKTESLHRLKDLKEDREKAKDANDDALVFRIDEEIQAIQNYLRSSMRIYGTSRSSASEADQARVNVTKVIKASSKNISKQIPSLGLYLKATIKTGMYFSYQPPKDNPQTWILGNS